MQHGQFNTSCVNMYERIYEPRHKISNNVVCTTSKASDQPAHARSLIRAFPKRLSNLAEHYLEFLSLKPVRVYTCQNATLLEISCTGSYQNEKGKATYEDGNVLQAKGHFLPQVMRGSRGEGGGQEVQPPTLETTRGNRFLKHP